MTAAKSLDTLSSHQVSVLLRVLATHQEFLEQTHQDAKRYSVTRARPCYILDYELIYRFMYEARTKTEEVVELEYLFNCPDILFIVGYGTEMELSYGLHRDWGIDVTSTGDDDLPSDDQLVAERPILRDLVRRKPPYPDTPNTANAARRLAHFLSRENCVLLTELEQRLGIIPIDERTYSEAIVILAGARAGEGDTFPNIADALNVAAVAALRGQLSDPSEFNYYPFLLTATRLLLDERVWAVDELAERWGFDPVISRTPRGAIYSHVMRQSAEARPDIDLADHTVDLAFRASGLKRLLRKTPGYKHDLLPQALDPRSVERLVAQHRVEEDFAKELATLTEFLSDPLVVQVQRFYDNAAATVRNSLHLESKLGEESPQRVVDFVTAISRVLQQGQSGLSGFNAVWRFVMTLEVYEHLDWTAYSFRDLDPGALAAPYLEVERPLPLTHGAYHQAEPGRYVLRWPNGANTDEVLETFSAAFERHNATGAIAHVGTTDGVLGFRVGFPLWSKELANEVDGSVLWIRLIGEDSGEPFSLYADFVTPAERDPMIAVTALHPDADHIVELFGVTCRRFVFESWLRDMLKSCGIRDVKKRRAASRRTSGVNSRETGNHQR